MATAGALRGAAQSGVDAAAAAAAARRGGVAGCARGAACLPRRGAAAAARAPPPPRAPRLRQPPCRRVPPPRAADGADAPPSAPPPPPTPRVVRIKVRALRSRALSPLVPCLKRLTVADSACVPPRPLRCQPEDMPTKDDYKPSCVAHAARLARPSARKLTHASYVYFAPCSMEEEHAAQHAFEYAPIPGDNPWGAAVRPASLLIVLLRPCSRHPPPVCRRLLWRACALRRCRACGRCWTRWAATASKCCRYERPRCRRLPPHPLV